MSRNLRSKTCGRVATLVGVLACLTVFGCGSKGAVAITADLHNPEMTVGQASGLAALLTGGFGLRASLGAAAPSGTDFALGRFNIVNADQATIVVLKLMANPGAPYHLEPGGNLDIAMTVADETGTPGQFLIKSEETAVCAARAAVQIVGSITEGGGRIPVTSATFQVTCP